MGLEQVYIWDECLEGYCSSLNGIMIALSRVLDMEVERSRLS